MATIFSDYGTSGPYPATGTDEYPPIADVLRDVADDFDDMQLTTAATADGVYAAGANPTKAEYDALVDLVNELKGIVNAQAAASLRTLKG